MKITIILTNWKRKNNLEKIIKETKKQSLLPKIVLVDNSSKDNENKFIYEGNDIEIIKRNNELVCWERWLASFNFESDYKCIMDDDLIFTRNQVLEDCFHFMEANKNVDCIGLEGVKLMKGKSYFECEHQHAKINHTIPVSIIKGRFMFIRSKSLIGLDMEPDLTCDDIKVSSHLKLKYLPSILWESFSDLPQGAESLSGKKFQSIQRDYATKRYFRN